MTERTYIVIEVSDPGPGYPEVYRHGTSPNPDRQHMETWAQELRDMAVRRGRDDTYEVFALVPVAELATQHAWTHWRDGVACPHRETEENARRIAASNRGGYVSVREVTDWRPESPQEQS